jgi:plastocyanin
VGALGALAILLLIGCARDDAPAANRGPVTPLDPALTGTVSGTVRLDGPVPPETVLHVAGDRACAALGRSEVAAGDVLVSAGRVENALVYVARGLEGRVFERPKETLLIDQRGCAFVPRIAAVESGQRIEFVNSDSTLHNVHIVAEHSAGMNFGLGVVGASRSVHIDAAEVMVALRRASVDARLARGSRSPLLRTDRPRWDLPSRRDPGGRVHARGMARAVRAKGGSRDRTRRTGDRRLVPLLG